MPIYYYNDWLAAGVIGKFIRRVLKRLRDRKQMKEEARIAELQAVEGTQLFCISFAVQTEIVKVVFLTSI
jgi:hypothetical protein